MVLNILDGNAATECASGLLSQFTSLATQKDITTSLPVSKRRDISCACLQHLPHYQLCITTRVRHNRPDNHIIDPTHCHWIYRSLGTTNKQPHATPSYQPNNTDPPHSSNLCVTIHLKLSQSQPNIIILRPSSLLRQTPPHNLPVTTPPRSSLKYTDPITISTAPSPL